MNKMNQIFFGIWVVAECFGIAHAQTYPTKSIRLIVPFPAGGGGDAMARTIAPAMAEGVGQPIVIENRGGAGTIIGTESVAKSAADGYTLLVVYPSFVISPVLYGVTRFDPVREFQAVGQVTAITMGIAVHPSLPATSLRELVALARSRPAEIAYGAGAGTGHLLLGELLRLTEKIKLTTVPYQGSMQMYPALLGGHISMIWGNAGDLAPYASAGKLRAIVVTTAKRDELFPQVQTVREAGFPYLEAAAWGGIAVRSGTPQTIVRRLNSELERALSVQAIVHKLHALGMRVAVSSPEQFSALIQSEATRYTKIIREAGIKAD